MREESGRRNLKVRFSDLLDRHFKVLSLAPAVVLLLVLTVFPVYELFYMATSEITFRESEVIREAAFAENLAKLRDDWIYAKSLKNTLIFVIVSTSIEMIMGFALALAVSQIVRGRGIVRTAMLLPILIPPIAIGNIWRLMYNPDFGIINAILTGIGLPAMDLLGSTSTALMSVIIVDVWHWTPLVFLILLAGLEALPDDVMEAANVDGATYWQSLRFVIVPLMMPALIVAFIFRSIVAFKVFDQVFLLTSGGPGTSTEVVSLYVYKVFFQQNQLGYGALLAIITIALVCAYLGVFAYARRRLAGSS